MSAESPRHVRSGGPLTVPAQPPPDRSIIDAVSGFINDVKLTSSSPVDPKDVIQWARFETADINEPTPEGDGDNEEPPLLLVLGYGAGVQVWLIPPNGEAQEVLSWRQGTVRVLRILPTPVKGDCFAPKRPLIALCDSAGPGPAFCSLSFISIRGGEQVKSIKFKNPILDVLANKRSVVVSFSERFAVFDAGSLEDRMAVTTCYPCPCPLGGSSPINPLTLGDRWLAYADNKLNPSKRSSGGCESDGVSSYTAAVLHAAKSLGRGLRGLGESVAQSLGGVRHSPSPPAARHGHVPGVVTVLDVQGLDEDEGQDSEEPYEPTIAHFIAHSEAITALKFDASGLLLVTADRRGHDFHVFRINPHPCGPGLASVHHLYVLHRGDTTAKVQDIAISPDSRWVAVSSLRGTTHVFGVSPYGGAAGVRTHTHPRVVNRLSRFHRSAGLALHDAWFPNPRLPPYPAPAACAALRQLRATPARAVTRTSAGRQRLSSTSEEGGAAPLLARAHFGAAAAQRPAAAPLYLLAPDGTLAHLLLRPRPSSNIPKEKICDESPIELVVEDVCQWSLRRSPTAGDLLAPLPPASPLLQPLSCRQCVDMCLSSEERWLSQVEIVTHAGPHRRLWMGPQFVFKTFNHGSSGSLDAEAVEIETGAVSRSNPVNVPAAVPLLLDSGSASSLEQSPVDGFRRKSIVGESRGTTDLQLKEDLAEAMKEDHEARRGRERAARGGAGTGPARAVGPRGTVVAAEDSAPAGPVTPPDEALAANCDEAVFRCVVRAPAPPPHHLPAHPLPLTTTIPAQPLPSGPEPYARQHVQPRRIPDPYARQRIHSKEVPDPSAPREIEVSREPRDQSAPRIEPREVSREVRDPNAPRQIEPRDILGEQREREAAPKMVKEEKSSPKEVMKEPKQRESESEGVIEAKKRQEEPEMRPQKEIETEIKEFKVDIKKESKVETRKEAKVETKNSKVDMQKELKLAMKREAVFETKKDSKIEKQKEPKIEMKTELMIETKKDSKIEKPKESKTENKIKPKTEIKDEENEETKKDVKKGTTKSKNEKEAKISKDSAIAKSASKEIPKGESNSMLESKVETTIISETITPPRESDTKPSVVKEYSPKLETYSKISSKRRSESAKSSPSRKSKERELSKERAKNKERDASRDHEDSLTKDNFDLNPMEKIDKPLPKEQELKISRRTSTERERSPRKDVKDTKKDVPENVWSMKKDLFPTFEKVLPKEDVLETKPDIKTEDQAWDMLNESDKPILSVNVTEEKPKLKKNRKIKKSQDDPQNKSEDDSFVEIHAIEETVDKLGSDDLVSISMPYDEASPGSYSKKKSRSPKPVERKEDLDAKFDDWTLEDMSTVKTKSPKKIDTDVTLPETDSKQKKDKTQSKIDNSTIDITQADKKNKYENRKSIEKDSDVRDVYVIDDTNEEFPDIQITRANKSRKKSPIIDKTDEIVEKPAIKSWSSIAASKNTKKIEVKEATKTDIQENTIIVDEPTFVDPIPSSSVSLQEELMRLCKRTDIMVAECDAPADSKDELQDLPPLDLDFGLDQFKLDVMRDSLIETDITSPICKIDIDNILSTIKESTSAFNLIDLEKVPDKKEKGFNVIQSDNITSQEVKVDDDIKTDEVEKLSDDENNSPVSTDSDKEDKKTNSAAPMPSPKQSSKSKKPRKKKK